MTATGTGAERPGGTKAPSKPMHDVCRMTALAILAGNVAKMSPNPVHVANIEEDTGISSTLRGN